MPAPIDHESDARSARRFLFVLGLVFALLAIACVVCPSWNVPAHAMPVCAALGAGLMAIARFVPDTWVRRAASLFVGWP